jgi:hypothetical protein
MIFQSLPVRTDVDPPEIAQLQVQIDTMEDRLVAMDVLAEYGILTSPQELRETNSSSCIYTSQERPSRSSRLSSSNA